MNPLRAALLPFQITSLLLVAFITLVIALCGTMGESIAPMRVLVSYWLLSWLNKYAFALLDHAANGITEAPVASVEMLGPWGDWRAIVHPALAAVLALGAWRLGIPGVYVAALVLPLLPASIGALAISHRFVDAVNPVVLWHTIRGLGPLYAVLLAVLAGCVGLEVAAAHAQLSRVPLFLLFELLLLCFYAVTGGAIHARRIELGFDPTHSPERRSARDADERAHERQRMLDAVYASLQAGNPTEGPQRLRAWLAGAGTQLVPDADAVIRQAASWAKDRAVAEALRTVASHCVSVRQPALALSAADAALRRVPAFSPANAADAVTMAEYARQTGRRGLARQLLDNYSAAHPEAPLDPPARRLRAELEG